jgi:hypothetical protein
MTGMFWLGLVIGIFIGANVGAFIILFFVGAREP